MGATIAGSLLALAGCGIDSDVSRQIGARCEATDDCDDRCLRGDDYPDGFCSRSCLVDADCPDGTACVDDDGGVCLVACPDDAACAYLGAGWSCETREAIEGGEVDVCRG